MRSFFKLCKICMNNKTTVQNMGNYIENKLDVLKNRQLKPKSKNKTKYIFLFCVQWNFPKQIHVKS